jgi:hypothetical protein
MSETEGKRGRGRPSSYDPAYCDQVVELGAQGKSRVQISALIGVHRSTLDDWAKAHPEFSEALTRAKELEQHWWEEQAQLGLWSKEFNAPLWKANVAGRFREAYGDKQTITHEGDLSGLSQDELDRRIAEKLAALGLPTPEASDDTDRGGDGSGE